MFLFSRVATPKGLPREVMAYATEVTDYVNSKVETTTTLWQNLFGAPTGTLGWNTLVRSRAHHAHVMMTLMGDDGFHDYLERGSAFWSDMIPTEDYLSRFVFGNPEQKPAEVGHVAEMISATPDSGRMVDAMAWGPEAAQMVARIGGTMPSFWTNAYGRVGDVAWITIYPSLEAVDEAVDKLQSSDEYLTQFAKGADLFVPGSGLRSSMVRVH